MYRFLLLLSIALVSHGAPIYDKWTIDMGGRHANEVPVPPMPIVLWHGMGDSCCSTSRGIGTLKASLEQTYGTFVYSIGFGGEANDVKSSYLGNVNDQIEEVCKKLGNITELRRGFDAIGFSQGGQFLRALVERCHDKLPPIRRLITMGAQHQGIVSIPQCTINPGYFCSFMRYILSEGAYWSWAAHNIIQAQYVKEPDHLDKYLASNIFLPDINNEKEPKTKLYADNLAMLDSFIMIRFSNDTVVVPRDSAWFSFYDGKNMIPIREQAIYKEDWIGLKKLDAKGMLLFDECPGNHMQFSWEFFQENVVEKYLIASLHPPKDSLFARMLETGR